MNLNLLSYVYTFATVAFGRKYLLQFSICHACTPSSSRFWRFQWKHTKFRLSTQVHFEVIYFQSPIRSGGMGWNCPTFCFQTYHKSTTTTQDAFKAAQIIADLVVNNQQQLVSKHSTRVHNHPGDIRILPRGTSIQIWPAPWFYSVVVQLLTKVLHMS